MATDPSAEEGTTGPDETQARILAAATQLFSQQGYARATTRAIAEAAGVNEVTLFRHFGTKKNLLLSVLERYSPLASLEEALETDPSGDCQQDLQRLGQRLMAIFGEHREALRLMLCEMEHFPQLGQVLGQMPNRLRQSLGRYLQRQVEQDRLRSFDPELMAQAFIGMFFAYNLYHDLFHQTPLPGIDPQAVATQFVEIFIQGVEQRGAS